LERKEMNLTKERVLEKGIVFAEKGKGHGANRV
jgi:hypothetical protein